MVRREGSSLLSSLEAAAPGVQSTVPNLRVFFFWHPGAPHVSCAHMTPGQDKQLILTGCVCFRLKSLMRIHLVCSLMG